MYRSLLLLLTWFFVAAATKKLIIDTDLYSDVELRRTHLEHSERKSLTDSSDAAALLIAATAPDVELLAVNVNEASSYTALCASAILAHYGLPDVPIGLRRPFSDKTFFDSVFYHLGEYASKIAYHWSAGSLTWGHAEDAWDPVLLYRKTLAESPDGSVTIASIGYLENVSPSCNSHCFSGAINEVD